jgi:hypothetical protein
MSGRLNRPGPGRQPRSPIRSRNRFGRDRCARHRSFTTSRMRAIEPGSLQPVSCPPDRRRQVKQQDDPARGFRTRHLCPTPARRARPGRAHANGARRASRSGTSAAQAVASNRARRSRLSSQTNRRCSIIVISRAPPGFGASMQLRLAKGLRIGPSWSGKQQPLRASASDPSHPPPQYHRNSPNHSGP